MANFLSDQLTNAAANPLVLNNSTTFAKVKRKYFSWTGDAAQNDTVQLVNIPKNARIMGGRVLTTALGSSVTLTLGDGTTANKYLTSTSVASASATDFANTIALSGSGSGGELAASITLTATLGGADPASGSIYGFVDYLLD